MSKIKVANNNFSYLQPVFLVGAVVDGKPNFMPASWVSRVNISPNIMMVSLNPIRHTYQGIKEHKVFSLSIPSADLVTKTDYCALVSGKNTDKSEIFELFYGEDKNAPMVNECPICAECKVIQEVTLADHVLVLGEVINTYVDENYLNSSAPDMEKAKSFVYTMPDNNYWLNGESLGKAWSIGKQLKK